MSASCAAKAALPTGQHQQGPWLVLHLSAIAQGRLARLMRGERAGARQPPLAR